MIRKISTIQRIARNITYVTAGISFLCAATINILYFRGWYYLDTASFHLEIQDLQNTEKAYDLIEPHERVSLSPQEIDEKLIEAGLQALHDPDDPFYTYSQIDITKLSDEEYTLLVSGSNDLMYYGQADHGGGIHDLSWEEATIFPSTLSTSLNDKIIFPVDSTDFLSLRQPYTLLPDLYFDEYDYYVIDSTHSQHYTLLATEQVRIQKELLMYSLLIFLLLTILTYIFSQYIARKALRDVKTIAEYTHNISMENLQEQLTLPHLPDGDMLLEIIDALNTTTTDLHEQVQKIQRFVYGVSHEFRTPLAILLGNIQLVQQTKTYEEKLPLMESVVKNMKRLLDTLLLLTRYQHDASDLDTQHTSSFSLLTVLQEIDAQLYPTYNMQESRLHVKEPMYTGEIALHVGAIELVIRNLLDNAYKFSPDGSLIDVHIEKTSITISNMSDDIVTDIALYEAFQQGDSSKSRQGFGLGLYMVQQLCAYMGRSVHHEYREGKCHATLLFSTPDMVR